MNSKYLIIIYTLVSLLVSIVFGFWSRVRLIGWLINTLIWVSLRWNFIPSSVLVNIARKSPVLKRVYTFLPDAHEVNSIGHTILFPWLLLWTMRNTLQVFFFGRDSMSIWLFSMVLLFFVYSWVRDSLHTKWLTIGKIKAWSSLMSIGIGLLVAFFFWTQFLNPLTQTPLRWVITSVIGWVVSYLTYTVVKKPSESKTRLSTIAAKIFLLAVCLSVLRRGYSLITNWIDTTTIEKIQLEVPEVFNEEDFLVEDEQAIEDEGDASDAQDILNALDEWFADEFLNAVESENRLLDEQVSPWQQIIQRLWLE